MSPRPTRPVQGSLFEEDFLVRTLGSVVRVADVALTELVANAWDAGASKVKITIPDSYDEELVVEDDGTGMTAEQFTHRWMTLAYNRNKHQGTDVEFPPGRQVAHRQAYGHNGVGRHGMLCFGDRYTVETERDGKATRFGIATSSGRDSFLIERKETIPSRHSGTRLSVVVKRNLCNADRIRGVLANRFIYDPRFEITVNAKSIPFQDLAGLVEQRTLNIAPNLAVEVFSFDAPDSARNTNQHGVAFWVSNRLVGEPSWILNRRSLLDGRLRVAKRLTVVVKSNTLVDEVLPDWSGFRTSEVVDRLFAAVGDYVDDVTRRLMADRIGETRDAVLAEHASELERLPSLGRMEVREFVEDVATANPTLAPDVLSAAVQAVIRLEETRSGRALLEKLAQLGSADVDGLNRLLDRWSVRDALSVLDEIERRIGLVEALEKLAGDSKVDELKTLHPLVTQARWLFGPEYESSQYISNTTIRNAVADAFETVVPAANFVNTRNRPDLVFLPTSTLSLVGLEQFDPNQVARVSSLLIVELKRGGFKIGREEFTQASNYVQDFLGSGHLAGNPRISAFVVGHEIDPRVQKTMTLGDRGHIGVYTYAELTSTASHRLFRLRERVTERYEGLSGVTLADHLHATQGDLFARPTRT